MTFDQWRDTTPVPIGADGALALLVAAVEAETDQSWECNSYHPSLWSALNVARAALATAAQPPADGALNTTPDPIVADVAMVQALEKLLANFESQHALLLQLGAPDFVAMRDQARAALSTAAQPPAGIWVPTELAERVQETMGEFLMDHGWRQQDMDTSDDFGALLAVATKAAAAPAAVAEPVAWLHDDPQRYDVIHAEVKDLLVKSRDAAGYLHRPLDKSAHYTIPLYTAPAPAAHGDALDAAKHCLEMGESFRALRRVVNLLLEARRNLGPEDHELRDRIDRLLRDDAASGAQGESND